MIMLKVLYDKMNFLGTSKSNGLDYFTLKGSFLLFSLAAENTRAKIDRNLANYNSTDNNDKRILFL